MINSNIITDRTVGVILFYFFITYIVLFGAFVTKGFVLGAFNPTYLSVIIPIFLFDGFKSIFESLIGGRFYMGKEDLSKITVIIPTINGEEVLGATLSDLIKRFDRNNIIVVSNGSTDRTVEIAKSYKVITLDIPDPIGKVGAINSALCHVKTPYTLLLDDDVLIGKAKIPTQALDSGCTAVAFRVLPIVRGVATLFQMYEYSKSMDIGKKFQNRFGSVMNVSGAIGLFHTKELERQINIHTGEFSGEDLQRTLLVHLSGKGSVIIADSIVYTDTPSNFRTLFNQRTYGWNPGLFSNIDKYMKIMKDKNSTISSKYDAVYNLIVVILLDPLRLALFPVMIYSPWYFVVMYVIYVLLETLSYIHLKAIVPYWVVLLYPFYGLINTLSRIISIGVFGYRRLTVHLDQKMHLDHYVKVSLFNRFVAIIMIMSVYSQFIFFCLWLRSPYFSESRENTVEIIRTISQKIP